MIEGEEELLEDDELGTYLFVYLFVCLFCLIILLFVGLLKIKTK